MPRAFCSSVPSVHGFNSFFLFNNTNWSIARLTLWKVFSHIFIIITTLINVLWRMKQCVVSCFVPTSYLPCTPTASSNMNISGLGADTAHIGDCPPQVSICLKIKKKVFAVINLVMSSTVHADIYFGFFRDIIIGRCRRIDLRLPSVRCGTCLRQTRVQFSP